MSSAVRTAWLCPAGLAFGLVVAHPTTAAAASKYTSLADIHSSSFASLGKVQAKPSDGNLRVSYSPRFDKPDVRGDDDSSISRRCNATKCNSGNRPGGHSCRRALEKRQAARSVAARGEHSVVSISRWRLVLLPTPSAASGLLAARTLP